MKIKARLCPNKCRALEQDDHNPTLQVRMEVVPTKITRPRRNRSTCDGIDYSRAWILDFRCPVCGYTIPITANDLLRESRHPKSNVAAGERAKDRQLAREGRPRWIEEEKTEMIKDSAEWELRSICHKCALKKTCSHSSIDHVGHIVQSCDKFVQEKKNNE